MSDDIRTQIEELLKSRKVLLFMKGTKQFPACGFSNTAHTSCSPGINDERYTFLPLLAPWLNRMMSVAHCFKPIRNARSFV